MSGVALVIGAASGIGRATAITFVQEGVSRIILADRNLEGLHGTEELLQKTNADVKAVSIEMDVSNEASVEAMVSEGATAFGSIQYVVNCAGILSRTIV